MDRRSGWARRQWHCIGVPIVSGGERHEKLALMYEIPVPAFRGGRTAPYGRLTGTRSSRSSWPTRLGFEQVWDGRAPLPRRVTHFPRPASSTGRSPRADRETSASPTGCRLTPVPVQPTRARRRRRRRRSTLLSNGRLDVVFSARAILGHRGSRNRRLRHQPRPHAAMWERGPSRSSSAVGPRTSFSWGRRSSSKTAARGGVVPEADANSRTRPLWGATSRREPRNRRPQGMGYSRSSVGRAGPSA